MIQPFFSQLAGSVASRRDLLRWAATGCGVSFLMPTMSARAAESRGTERPKSLITLWMSGGPSQLETWDPHPGTSIGGPTKAIKTTIPGLEIAEHFPLMAEQMQHLSVVRSLVSKEGDHERGTYHLLTGYRPDPTVVHPALGAIMSHALPDDRIEIPLHVSLIAGGFNLPRGGFLGDQFDGFQVFEPGQGLHNLRSRVTDDRQQRRLAGLGVASSSFRKGRETLVENTLHQRTMERALTMMKSEQLAAFEIDKEPKETIERYGNTRFGRGCLVARKLVQTGVRAVHVVLDGFDTHTKNFEGHTTQAATLDPAFSALIADLVSNDLLDSTVVVCLGEFGRSPKINGLDGRDHWPTGFSCVLGGGGLAKGRIVGETDPTGEDAMPKDPVKVADLSATILKAVGVDGTHQEIAANGRPIAYNDNGKPIENLF